MAGEFQPDESKPRTALPVLARAAQRGGFTDSHCFELTQPRFRLGDRTAQPQIRVVISAAVEESAIARKVMAEAQLFVFSEEHNPLRIAKVRFVKTTRGDARSFPAAILKPA